LTSASPIVVLDSGLGGLTVVRALRRALPGESIVYFGDTARVPYGSKTAATVTTFVKQIIRFLAPLEPKHVVIACNTATALSLGAAREAFPELSITGVIEPGARAAVAAAGTRVRPTIGIIATEATVRSRAYEHAIARLRQNARLVCRATPLLVPIIEEGRDEDDPLVLLALEQYLQPLTDRALDVLVLGCTHYPVYRSLIRRVVGDHVAVIDSADECAEDVARRLRGNVLMRADLDDDVGAAAAGTLQCYVTDDPVRFARLAPRFVGCAVGEPTWVSAEELYDGPPGAAGPGDGDPETTDDAEMAAVE